MIESAKVMLRALLRGAGLDRDRAQLAARLEALAQQNAALERAVLAHQKTADELRRLQADFARAQRMAKIGHWRWCVPRNALIEGSEVYAEIHGVAPSEIHECMDHLLSDVIHPEDRERIEREFRAADTAGSGYQAEYRIVRSDGDVRHVREIGENIPDAAGRIVEQVGTLQDITELKRAEAALRSAHDELERRVLERTRELEAANRALRAEAAERKRAEAQRKQRELLLQSAARLSKLGYAVWDEREGKYVQISEEFAQLVGLTPEEFERQFPTAAEEFEAVHPEDRARYKACEDAYKAKPSIVDIEYRVINPRGEVVHVRELTQPVLDAQGRLAQSILAIQDITDQKRTEEQLRQAQKMEAVGQLTGGIAHDFNNLLAVILGNLELLDADGVKDAHAAEWVRTSITAAERGASLTQRLLAFSRKQTLRPVAVDANALVQGMLDLLRRTLGERIDVELVRDAGLCPCLVDRNQLENAILNLAINARDAMPDGGKLTISSSNARIDEETVNAKPDVKPGPYVLIAVSDTGAGMSEEIQQHAFEPFFTTKDLGRGSGLGLSMVYGFTKQSGGHASVDSAPGLGTTIRLYLPRYSGEKLAEEPELGAIEPAQATGERILVVEDNAELRALVVRMLRSLGYRVLEASSGAPALEIIRSTEVDLLLSDVVLPDGMSGSDLVEQARRTRPALRALHMSGYTEDAAVHRSRLADGGPFLQKPFRKVDVARAVREALDRSGSKR